jgi:hypothetical protein
VGVAGFSLLLSAIVIGPSVTADATGSFDLTLTQARNMSACMPRSAIDPNASRVCFSGRLWLNSLPSYARSSNQRLDICATALKITVIGDIIALPFLFDPPTTAVYLGALDAEAGWFSVCYG